MKKSSPAWTLGSRRGLSLTDVVPGPGTYNPLSNGESSPSYRIGKSSRSGFPTAAEIPGPGAYESKDLKKNSPRATIGKSLRETTNVFQTTPGPGRYNGTSSSTGPSFSFSGSREHRLAFNNPGPADYTPSLYSKTLTPAYAIGRAKRLTEKPEFSPGPGSYDVIPDHSGPKWKVGTEQRSANLSQMNFPGPGTYDSSIDRSMPSFSMTARRPTTRESIVPGPGAYSPKHSFVNVQYSLPHASRSERFAAQIPGPASYFIESPRSKAAVFGRSKRIFTVGEQNNPGPGRYEAKPVASGPMYTIGSKNVIQHLEKVPGPGEYEPKAVLKSEPAWAVGKQKREVFKINDVPGPGSYEGDTKDHGGPKWVFSRSQRVNHDKEKVPGPGSYEIKALIPDVPAYLINSNS